MGVIKKFFGNINLLLPLMVMVVLSSCGVTRNIPKEQNLLVKNKYEIEKKANTENFSVSELKDYVKQKPNKKLFGYRFHLRVYNVSQKINFKQDTTDMSGPGLWFRSKKKNFQRWLAKNGEEPVILDSNLTDKSVDQLEYLLFTKGYFNSEVSRDVNYKKRKKAVVTYYINPGTPYVIDRHTYAIQDTAIQSIVYDPKNLSGLAIKHGEIYDEKMLKDERDRLTKILKDEGYYFFNKAYIRYEVDTFVEGAHNLKITTSILDQSFFDPNNPDSIINEIHKPCRVNLITINTDYQGSDFEDEYKLYVHHSKDSSQVYYFKYFDHMRYKPQAIVPKILFKTGDLYSQTVHDKTYKLLNELRNFRNIRIEFIESPDSSLQNDSMIWLDCRIVLSRWPKQSYEFQADATSTAGDPGMSVNLVFQNKNLFRGAEILNTSISTAFEVQKIIDETQQSTTIIDWLPFNTFEFGAEANLLIPKLLPESTILPFSGENTKTSIIGGFNYQERPDYRRYISRLSAGYDIQLNPTMKMEFNLLELNSVSIFKDPSFAEKLELLNDQRLLNSYSDHIISAMNFSFVFSNQQFAKRKTQTHFRVNVEQAGWGVDKLKGPLNYNVNKEGQAMVFNIPYAQYLRFNSDFRMYFNRNDQTFAFRIGVGVGNPYGNMTVLPFEKSFFVGGANGIRAWPIRTIGPGSFTDTLKVTRFDKTGDYGLELSVEHRFPIYSSLNGAVFVDAGNVWLKNESEQYPGGVFDPSKFLTDLAVGTGVGARLDFSFLIIRVDAGVKVHDPSKDEGERWVIDDFKFKHINWNIAIGHPF